MKVVFLPLLLIVVASACGAAGVQPTMHPDVGQALDASAEHPDAAGDGGLELDALASLVDADASDAAALASDAQGETDAAALADAGVGFTDAEAAPDAPSEAADAGQPTDTGVAPDAGLGPDAAAQPDAATVNDAGIVLDPFTATPTCTSGRQSRPTDNSPTMSPGQACLSCHQRQGIARNMRIAGTIYPSAHEPDLCQGATPATVEIYDAQGARVASLTTNRAGNFTGTQVAPPNYSAHVLLNGREVWSTSPHNGGDCNACHTQSGSSGARGRIIVP